MRNSDRGFRRYVLGRAARIYPLSVIAVALPLCSLGCSFPSSIRCSGSCLDLVFGMAAYFVRLYCIDRNWLWLRTPAPLVGLLLLVPVVVIDVIWPGPTYIGNNVTGSVWTMITRFGYGARAFRSFSEQR